MTEDERKEGNRIIQDWMGWKLESTTSSITNNSVYQFTRYDENGNVIDEHFGGDSWSWKENSTFPYDSDWNLLMSVRDKIHDLEEEYPVVKNNFHIWIQKRFVRFIYDWDGWNIRIDGNHTPEEFERFKKASKDYRYVVFDNDPKYALWTGIIDFIKWFKEQKTNQQ